MKTLITNGTVVNATGAAPADVLIDGETVVAVLSPGSTLLSFDLSSNVDRVIDRFQAWQQKAAGSCAIDYGFHQILSDVQAPHSTRWMS